MSPLYNPYRAPRIPKPHRDIPRGKVAKAKAKEIEAREKPNKLEQKLQGMSLEDLAKVGNPHLRRSAQRALSIRTAINSANSALRGGESLDEFLKKNPNLAQILRDSGALGAFSNNDRGNAPFWTRTEFKEIISETTKYMEANAPSIQSLIPSDALKIFEPSMSPNQETSLQTALWQAEYQTTGEAQQRMPSPSSPNVSGATLETLASNALNTQLSDQVTSADLKEAKTSMVPKIGKYGVIERDELGNIVFEPIRTDESNVPFRKSAEWKEYKQLVDQQDIPWWKREAMKGFYYVMGQVKRFGEAVNEVFGIQKDFVAQGDESGLFATGLHAIFNTAAFVGVFLNDMRISGDEMRQKADVLRSQINQKIASGVPETDPELASLKKQFEDADRLANMGAYQDQLYSRAKLAMHQSWEKFGESASKIAENPKTLVEPWASPEAEQKRQSAALLAKSQRSSAYDLVNQANQLVNSDPEKALKLYESATKTMLSAQKNDALSDPMDPTWSYSWSLEPERERIFREAMASWELQLGRPLNSKEVRRLKQYYENGWTEFWGESVLDITNVIPAEVFDTALKAFKPSFWDGLLGKTASRLEAKGWVKTAETIMRSRELVKTSVENAPIISYLRRQTVASVASKRQNSIYYVFSRLSGSYRTTDEFMAAMPQIGQVANELRYITNEKAARMAFENAAQKIPSLQAITFDEFKRIFDILDVEKGGIEFTKWSDIYRQATIESEAEIRRVTEQALRQSGKFADEDALRAEVVRQVKNAMESPSENGWTLGNFAEKFAGAYTDSHRLYKGSILFDDSLSGQMALYFRKIADDSSEDSMVRKIFKKVTDKWASGEKLTWAERINHAMAAAAAVRNPGAKRAALMMADVVEGMVKFGKFTTDIWAMFVLSLNPRWIVQNYIDSSVRAWVAGSNPLDSAATMLMSLHRQLVDELGFLPIELGQSLARDGLNFSTSVTGRLVYGDWKPLPGPFGFISYFQYEVDRLRALRNATLEEASVETAKAFSQRFPEGSMMRKMTNLMGGVKFYGEALSGAAQDFNTAIEFTLRLRLFHGEYFKNLRRLERVLNETGKEILSPEIQKLAKQIWNSSESNPRKITALVESIIRGDVSRDPAAWSTILPPNLMNTLSQLTEQERSILISDIRNQLDVLVESIYKSGRKPVSADFVKFFDDFEEDFKNTVNIQMANSRRTREISGQPGNQATSIPEQMAMSGSAVDREKVNAAVERIGKNVRGRFDPTKSFGDFQTAMANVAPIKVIPGSDRLIIDPDGTVAIGEALIAGKRRGELNDLMHEIAIKSFVQQEWEFAGKAGFSSPKEFEDVFRLFLDEEGPAKVLARNSDQFLAIIDEMETNPTLRRILERTRGRAIPYEQTWKNYIQNMPLDKLRGQAWFDIVQARADQAHLPPAHVRHAAVRQSKQTLELQKLVNSHRLSPELEQQVRNFLSMYDQARKDLGQFYLWTEPGPKLLSVGEARSLAWDQFYWRQAEAYGYGETLIESIAKKINDSPEEARQFLENFNGDFYTNFLNAHGITDFTTVDAGSIPISNFKFSKGGKTFEIRSEWVRKDLYERFLSPEKKAALAGVERFDIGEISAMPLERQLLQAVQDSFQLTLEQSKMYSRIIKDHIDVMVAETGKDSEYFLKRMGFVRVEGHLRAPDALRQVNTILDAEGRHVLYGFGAQNSTDLIRQSSVMFYDDLRMIAGAGGEKAVDDLYRINDFLEKATGRKIIQGKLQDEHLQLFADAFQKYVLYGDSPNSKLKKPFERFATWMNKVNGNSLDKTVATDLPADVVEIMDRMFTLEETKPATSANRTMRIMAQNAGLSVKKPEDLLKIVNDHVAALPGEQLKTLKVEMMKLGRPEEEVDAALSLIEYRARAWAAQNPGKSPAEYLDRLEFRTAVPKNQQYLAQMFERLPSNGERRQPAFEQLRDMWDTLDAFEQKEVFMWLTEKTLTDPLSGAETVVAKAISEKPSGWIEATSDLNSLKAINDTWGHEAGDDIIANMGRIAKEETEKRGGRVFRVGGDEFTYWFSDEKIAQETMNAIDQRLFQSAFTIGGEERKGFSIAFGIGDERKLADKNLYSDKLRRVFMGQRSTARGGMSPSIVKATETSPNLSAMGAIVEPLPDGGALVHFADGNTDKIEATALKEFGGLEELQKMVDDAATSAGSTVSSILPSITTQKRILGDVVNTPEFKSWFLNSKIVDKNGKPLIVYHGTHRDFTQFQVGAEMASDGGFYGRGVYFSPNPEMAGDYAMKRTPKTQPANVEFLSDIDAKAAEQFGDVGGDVKGANVMPVYVSLQNPFQAWDMGAMKQFGNTPDEITKNLIQKGYDGVVVWRTKPGMGEPVLNEIVAFDPRQIKSVFNSGEFNISSRSILHQDTQIGKTVGAFWEENGKKIIALLENNDVSTLPHELGHLFRTDLPDEDLKVIERAVGFGEGEWARFEKSAADIDELLKKGATKAELRKDIVAAPYLKEAERWAAAEEKFANGFVVYLKSGKSPIPELTSVFEKFKQWLSEVWQWVKGSPSLHLTSEVRGVYDRLFQLPAGELRAPIRYTSLGEVPHNIAAQAFKSEASQKMVDNLDAAFDVWKLRYDMQGLPQPALKNFSTAKAYVRQMFDETTGDLANQYRILLWRMEQFEDTMTESMMKQGFLDRVEKEVGDFFAPPLDEVHMDDGVKTFLRNGINNRKIYDQTHAGIQEWRDFLAKAADNGTPFPVLTKDEIASLRSWASGAAERKANLMNLAINGGEYGGVSVEGALPMTNRFMLDYQDRNNFDQIMKNFFPFWMFPSRSLPFWTNTLATHPKIVLLYQKLRKWSETERYQAGAVSSKGLPLPSLENYIPIPGLGMWINPTAPLSFRYLLDMQSYANDMMYEAKSAQGGDEAAYSFVAKQVSEMSQVFGFSVGPWIQYSMKKMGVPTQDWAIIPQLSLLPPWWMSELIYRAETILNWNPQWANNLAQSSEQMMRSLSPEPKWHDFLIERNMLEEATKYTQNPKLSDSEKKAYLSKIGSAISEKGNNPIWMEAYRKYVQEEKKKNVFAFFTGFYPKEFTDSQADLLQARNEYNMRASAMNNSYQASLFSIPVNEQARWDTYRQQYRVDTPLGWLYHLYNDIGWVTDESDRLVTDPKERAKLVAARVDEDNNARAYYQATADLEKWKNTELAALPVGASYEQTREVLDKYYQQLFDLEEKLMPAYSYMGSNKPVTLLEKDMRNVWWKRLTAARPGWWGEDVETYAEYEARLKQWEQDLPTVAKIYAIRFKRDPQVRSIMEHLDTDQPIDLDKLAATLISESTIDNYNLWKLENDDVFTALNTVWKENYWDKYWDTVGDLSSTERDIAEEKFFRDNKQPDVAQLYQWIVKKYGPDRFTPNDIQRWMMNDPNKQSEVYGIDERHLQDVGETSVLREKIWSLLSWAGPGKQRDVLQNAFVDSGGNPKDLEDWYAAPPGTSAWQNDPAHVKDFYDRLTEAANRIHLSAPSIPQMEQFLKARQENDLLNDLLIEKLGRGYQSVLDEYFFKSGNLNRQDFGRWKHQNPDAVKMIRQYFYIRTTFGYAHKLWASYYLWSPRPHPTNMGYPELNSPSGYQPAISGSDKKAEEIMDSPNWQQSRSPLQFSFGPAWPKNMRGNVSQNLVHEVESAYRGYGNLSSSARSYLNSLYRTHPEWRQFIVQILTMK